MWKGDLGRGQEISGLWNSKIIIVIIHVLNVENSSLQTDTMDISFLLHKIGKDIETTKVTLSDPSRFCWLFFLLFSP